MSIRTRSSNRKDPSASIFNSPDVRGIIVKQMLYLSGEMPRVTPYERGLRPHVKLARDGVGWDSAPLILTEHRVAARVKGKCAAAFTARPHSGEINVLKDARNALGGVPPYALVGGAHHSGAKVG